MFIGLVKFPRHFTFDFLHRIFTRSSVQKQQSHVPVRVIIIVRIINATSLSWNVLSVFLTDTRFNSLYISVFSWSLPQANYKILILVSIEKYQIVVYCRHLNVTFLCILKKIIEIYHLSLTHHPCPQQIGRLHTLVMALINMDRILALLARFPYQQCFCISGS